MCVVVDGRNRIVSTPDAYLEAVSKMDGRTSNIADADCQSDNDAARRWLVRDGREDGMEARA